MKPFVRSFIVFRLLENVTFWSISISQVITLSGSRSKGSSYSKVGALCKVSGVKLSSDASYCLGSESSAMDVSAITVGNIPSLLGC